MEEGVRGISDHGKYTIKIIKLKRNCEATCITHLVQHSQVSIVHCVTGAGIKMSQTSAEPEFT